MKKLYIIQKYIWANSIQEALKKEKGAKTDEVFFEAEWRKNNLDINGGGIGKNKLGFEKK